MKIGIMLPIAEDRTSGETPRWAEIRALALQAEASGFDSVWVYDHMIFQAPERPPRGVWEGWTLLAALAAATERAELGVLVLCMPFRNPAVLAKMAATLDEVSNGRLILGLGAGWYQPEFEAFGVPFDHRVDRFEEGLQIIAPLLRAGHADLQGHYYRATNAQIVPRGPRAAGPPLLIGAFGPRMLNLTARYADAWNTCWLGDPAGLAAPRAALEAACIAAGRDPATIDITVGVAVAYPPFGPEGAPPPDKALSGSAEAIAAGLRGYAALGVSHLICMLSPMNGTTLAQFGDAMRLARE